MKNPKDYYVNWRDAQCKSWASEEISRKNNKITQHQLLSVLAQQYSGRARRVLDVGCAAGTTLSMLDSSFEEKLGVDLVKWPQWANLHGIQFKQVDLNEERLPFPDSHFSLVICSNVLEHVFNVFLVVKELFRVCELSGYLIVGVPNVCYIKNLIRLLRGWSPRTAIPVFPFKEDIGWDGQHLHMFSLREMRILLKQHCFEVVDVQGTGMLMKLRKIWPSMLFADMYIVSKRPV